MMTGIANPTFTFVSTRLPEDTFHVVSFTGEEGLSSLYRFDILLASKRRDANMEEVVNSDATLTIKRSCGHLPWHGVTEDSNHRDIPGDTRFPGAPPTLPSKPPEGDLPFHGVIETWEQMQRINDYTFYRVVLRPKLWWLTLTRYSQVFLDKRFPEFIASILTQAGLSVDVDFKLSLIGEYNEAWQLVCQYDQTLYDFFCWWMEREGAYFFFEQKKSSCVAVLTDSSISHLTFPGCELILYRQPSGMGAEQQDELIYSFVSSERSVPARIRLREFNANRPDLTWDHNVEVSETGRGELYYYGENFRHLDEARTLGRIRAEAHLFRRKLFHGESTAPTLRPGYTFKLRDHFGAKSNELSYLTTEVHHVGNQAAYLRESLGIDTHRQENAVRYRNSFTAGLANKQYRPERVTQKSRILGSLHARVDAEGSGKYADLSEDGAYKIILPFDLAEHAGGKASSWIRMMQPYAGAGNQYGIHFPLHKGAEVILTFIDGDPDRPVISGALPNDTAKSPVTADNETQCAVVSAGGNKILLEDQDADQRIDVYSPYGESLVRVGSSEKDDTWYSRMGFTGVGFVTPVFAPKTTAVRSALNVFGLALGEKMGTEEGIAIRTKNSIKMASMRKAEAIGGFTDPGYSTTSVTGMCTHSVTGYSDSSVKGYANISVMGARNALYVGDNSESNMGFKEYLAAKKESLVASANKVKGWVTKAYGSLTKVSESEKSCVIELVELNGSKSEVTEEDVELGETSTSVKGEELGMVVEMTEMCSEKTESSVSVTEVVAEQTVAVGESTVMKGEEILSVGERVVTAGEEVRTAGASMNMNGETIFL